MATVYYALIHYRGPRFDRRKIAVEEGSETQKEYERLIKEQPNPYTRRDTIPEIGEGCICLDSEYEATMQAIEAEVRANDPWGAGGDHDSYDPSDGGAGASCLGVTGRLW